VAGKVAGTAVAGPIGGFAASFVGSRLGSTAVRVGKRVLGIGKKPEPLRQAAAAPGAGREAAAAEPDRPPAASEPPAEAAPPDEPAPVPADAPS
jgi:pyruvate/2-oxoglutarate dehydrogenase complex dihydrolipoamide acyltransferase (E2) component